VNPTKGVPPLLVKTIDKSRDPHICAWFLSCKKPAVADVEHLTLGWIPICAEHLDWIQAD
jgi:hypothetical protein